jgi:hypothetical protein
MEENNNSWVHHVVNSKFVRTLSALIFIVFASVIFTGLLSDKHINFFGLEFNGNNKNPVTENPVISNPVISNPVIEKEKVKETITKDQSIKKAYISPLTVKSKKIVKKDSATNLQIGNGNTQAPVNITSNNQTGGITAQNVNVTPKPLPRKLNNQQKLQLINYLNDKNEKIDLCSLMNDPEAFEFSYDIEKFLKENGYKNVNGGNQGAFIPPFRGIQVERKNSVVFIRIGLQN